MKERKGREGERGGRGGRKGPVKNVKPRARKVGYLVRPWGGP